MGTENIQIVATARDNASPQLKKLKANVAALGTRSTGPLGGLTAGLGGISPLGMAAAVGIGAFTAALGNGIAGAIAEEKQLTRLDTALRANVKNWDGNREAIDRSVDSMMDLAFSDDEARESMIKLVTATGDVEKATRYMALAADIARGREIDLATATDIVNKANMGNVGALRRMGIELDKGATKTEILTELQRRYAGQSAAYAQTTGGKLEAAKVKVDNFMESVGNGMIMSADLFGKGADFIIWKIGQLGSTITGNEHGAMGLGSLPPGGLTEGASRSHGDKIPGGWRNTGNGWDALALFSARISGYTGMSGQGGLDQDEYRSGVQDIVDAIRASRNSSAGPGFGSGVKDYPGYAAGGDAKGSFVVGERGPEILHLGNRGGRVTPNHQMGGHGHAIVLNGRILGQAVDEYLGNQLSRMPTAPIHRG